MYTLKKDVSGEVTILHREGKPLFCPFKPILLVPSNISGQLQMHREPCGTHCPLFMETGRASVQLFCGIGITVGIDETEEEVKPQPKLIKL